MPLTIGWLASQSAICIRHEFTEGSYPTNQEDGFLFNAVCAGSSPFAASMTSEFVLGLEGGVRSAGGGGGIGEASVDRTSTVSPS